MSCKYCDGSGIGHGDDALELCVFENHGHPEIVLPMGNGSLRADVDFCPKCGRNLREKGNGFEYSIKIPVPIGEKVYTFWTDCCNACAFQPKDNKAIFCGREAPCHTLKHAIQSKVLTFSNLETVLDGWGVFYFKTSKEAEEAGNKRVAENIKRMRELGYKIDDDGYAWRAKGWDKTDD